MERPGEVCTVCPTCVSSRNVFEGVGSRVERGGLMDKAGVGAKVWLKETAVPAWCHKEKIYIYLKISSFTLEVFCHLWVTFLYFNQY